MSLSRIFPWPCTLALLATAYAVVRDTAPEDSVKSFVEAWNAKEMNKAAPLVVGGKPDASFNAMKSFMADQWPKLTVSSASSNIDGNKATVSLTYSVEIKGQPDEDVVEPIDLVKVDDHWLIVPVKLGRPDNERKFVGVMAAMITQPDIFTPANKTAFIQAKKAAKKSACLSNIKQIALGLIMLTADNDDVFKIDTSRVKAAIAPYLKNDTLWYCPEAGSAKVAYSFNANLARKNVNTVEDMANTVLVYEGSKGKLDFRHEGYAAVAFVNGHVKMINEEAAKKLLWKP